jgi:hypothetical protein
MDYPNGSPCLSLVLSLGVANFRPQRMKWPGLSGHLLLDVVRHLDCLRHLLLFHDVASPVSHPGEDLELLQRGVEIRPEHHASALRVVRLSLLSPTTPTGHGRVRTSAAA